MGMIEQLATKAMVKTIRKSIPAASSEKLIQHYNKLQEAYRATDDIRAQGELFQLQQDIRDELERRGDVTPQGSGN